MRERHQKISQIRNSRRRFSRAIFTSACFLSLLLSWEASLMAVLIFAKSADELNFWMANSKGAEDFEGFCFHRKYECSAMMAVTEQWNSSQDTMVINVGIHTNTQKGSVLKGCGIVNLHRVMLWSGYWLAFTQWRFTKDQSALFRTSST